jgi:hypothetical protein
VIGTYYKDEDIEIDDPTLFLVFNIIDNIFTVLFTLECILKVIRNGFFVSKTSYLRDPWSLLDFVIVVSSLVDWGLESVKLPILKVLRLLRTLRPLRFISKNPSMKIVVNALLESLVALLNVMIVIGMVWVMFAILGSNLMQGKMGYCAVDSEPNFNPYGVSKQACLETFKGTWRLRDSNFENVGEGVVTLYVLSTLEGWPNILGWAMDADDETLGPVFNNSITNGLFIVVFILFGSLFLMNLFVGVIFVQFSEEQRKEKLSRFSMVTDDQMRWIMIQDLLETATPTFDVMIRPKGKVKIFVFRLVQSKAFEIIIMACIILNIVTMAMVYDGMSDAYSNALGNVNLAFTAIFVAEFVLKVIAFDLQYFKVSWNVFDFCIVSMSKFNSPRHPRLHNGQCWQFDSLPEPGPSDYPCITSSQSLKTLQANSRQAAGGHQQDHQDADLLVPHSHECAAPALPHLLHLCGTCCFPLRWHGSG